MITNQRKYQVTQKAIRDFECALDKLESGTSDTREEMSHVYRAAFESQIEDLKEQLEEYDALRNGRVRELPLNSLTDLPVALIKARVAAGLIQGELAERLGLKEQQIQRYEARNYDGVSFVRMLEIADALGVWVEGRVELSHVTVESKV